MTERRTGSSRVGLEFENRLTLEDIVRANFRNNLRHNLHLVPKEDDILSRQPKLIAALGADRNDSDWMVRREPEVKLISNELTEQFVEDHLHSFDIVTLHDVLGQVEDPVASLKLAKRLLKSPSSLLSFTVFGGIGRRKNHVLEALYTSQSIEEVSGSFIDRAFETYEVEAMIAAAGLRVVASLGVGMIFRTYDYHRSPSPLTNDALATYVELEADMSGNSEAFATGEKLHYICASTGPFLPPTTKV